MTNQRAFPPVLNYAVIAYRPDGCDPWGEDRTDSSFDLWTGNDPAAAAKKIAAHLEWNDAHKDEKEYCDFEIYLLVQGVESKEGYPEDEDVAGPLVWEAAREELARMQKARRDAAAELRERLRVVAEQIRERAQREKDKTEYAKYLELKARFEGGS